MIGFIEFQKISWHTQPKWCSEESKYSRRSTKQVQTIPKQVSRTQFRAACPSTTVLIAEAVVQVEKQDVDEFGKELTDVSKNDDLRCCVQTARRNADDD